MKELIIIIKKGYIYLEKLEKHQKINNEKDNNAVPDISSINNQKQPNRNEPHLNELIYAGEKLVDEKIGIHSKSTKKKSKPRWEIRQEIQIKNLRKQAKMIKQ